MVGKPAPKKLFLGAFVDGLGQVLDTLLVAPGIVDDQPSLELAEVQVRVGDVAPVCSEGRWHLFYTATNASHNHKQSYGRPTQVVMHAITDSLWT